MANYYGGIEAGGTKFICAVGSGPDDIHAEIRFATTSPDETLGQAVAFFEKHHSVHPLAAIGIASFGPVELDTDAPNFGFITETPKPGWSNANVVGEISKAFDIPIGFDTDVNGALLGEHRWGALKDSRNCIYLTIGTGIGGGAMVDGQLVHGLVHPEMGHIRLHRDPARDPYEGWCPFHGDCFEGLASGPALEMRWGQPGETLDPNHPGWELQSDYIAQALHMLICVLSPQRIVLGGGIMNQRQLFPMIRQKVLSSLNGYVKNDTILSNIDSYIVPPGLGNQAGVLGAIALARDAL